MTRKDTPAKHGGKRTDAQKKAVGVTPTAAEKAEAASWARATARGQIVPGRDRRTK